MSKPPRECLGTTNYETGRPFQFGLRGMLSLVTAICVVLAVGVQWGVLGLCVGALACVLLGLLIYVRPIWNVLL